MSQSFSLVNQFQPVAEYALSSGTQYVGRSSDCELVLKHPTVSRRHAAISVENSSITVQDLGSRNGTFVNGERIQTATVILGQQLAFGRVCFFLAGEKDEEFAQEPTTDACRSDDPRTPLAALVASLSQAERRVFDLLIEGMAEKRIGSRLHISQHTVHSHVRAIYRAFDVHSRPELFARLISAGQMPRDS